jgi:hypothetical protein
VAYRTGKNAVCWRTQETIQADLGRAGKDTSNVRTLLTKAVEAGLVEVVRRHLDSKTRNLYRPLLRAVEGDDRNWVELPTALLHALAAGDAPPGARGGCGAVADRVPQAGRLVAAEGVRASHRVGTVGQRGAPLSRWPGAARCA